MRTALLLCALLVAGATSAAQTSFGAGASMSAPGAAAVVTPHAEAPILRDSRGVYRGRLSANPYDADSVSNPYGRYGSPYSPDSINNPYGAGSPYAPDSPHNPFGRGLRIFGED